MRIENIVNQQPYNTKQNQLNFSGLRFNIYGEKPKKLPRIFNLGKLTDITLSYSRETRKLYCNVASKNQPGYSGHSYQMPLSIKNVLSFISTTRANLKRIKNGDFGEQIVDHVGQYNRD